MGTCFSSEATPLRATAHVFSGREDPSWELTRADALHLAELWRALPPSPPKRTTVSALGYRGCSVANDRGERWTAAGGQVTCDAAGAVDVRADPERRFERAVLATAPPGLLPGDLVAASRS